jgi:hypothetical protein
MVFCVKDPLTPERYTIEEQQFSGPAENSFAAMLTAPPPLQFGQLGQVTLNAAPLIF